MSDTKLNSSPGSGPDKPATGDDAPVAWPVRAAGPSRHGAISRKLFTYSNYKSWAEKMRVTLEEEEETAEEVTRVP